MSLPDFNEVGVIRMGSDSNQQLGIGLGDCDMNYGWFEMIRLTHMDRSLGESYEAQYPDGSGVIIHRTGRFKDYVPLSEMAVPHSKVRTVLELYSVMVQGEFGPELDIPVSVDFDEQMAWIHKYNTAPWTFEPIHGPVNGNAALTWHFQDPDTATYFKVKWG